MVGRIERSREHLKLGYKAVRGPLLTSLVIPYGGILGDLSDNLPSVILEKLLGEIREENVDRLKFHYLAEGSSMLGAVVGARRAFWQAHLEPWTPHWQLTIPADIKTFWSKLSKNHRHFLRRIANALEREHPGRIRYEDANQETQVGRVCEEVEGIAQQTYLRGMSEGFISDRAHIERLVLAARNNRFRAYLLYIDDIPGSYLLGPVYNKTFYGAYIGYDPRYRKYDIGQLVLVHAIESLSKEGIERFDFGFGTAFYKERFGDAIWRERSVALYAPSFKSAVFVTTMKMAERVTDLTKRLLNNAGLITALKRRWRRRLTKG